MYSINAEHTITIQLPWLLYHGRYRSLVVAMFIALLVVLPVVAYEMNIAVSLWFALAMTVVVYVFAGCILVALDANVKHRVRRVLADDNYRIDFIEIVTSKNHPFNTRSTVFTISHREDTNTCTQLVLLQGNTLYICTAQQQDA